MIKWPLCKHANASIINKQLMLTELLNLFVAYICTYRVFQNINPYICHQFFLIYYITTLHLPAITLKCSTLYTESFFLNLNLKKKLKQKNKTIK